MDAILKLGKAAICSRTSRNERNSGAGIYICASDAHSGSMSHARKKATNLSIDPELHARAKAQGINLSEALEAKLVEIMKTSEREAWLAQNRTAIDAYNARVAEGPILSDDEKLF